MAYAITDDFTGAQPIADTSLVQNHFLQKRVRGIDPTYGEGEFIYLKGVANTVVGSGVVWTSAGQTALTVATSSGAFAVAMSANVANQYGWYQIQGIAVAKTGTVVSGATAQTFTATPGQIDDTTTATQYIDGATFKSADGTPAAGFALVSLSYPNCNLR